MTATSSAPETGPTPNNDLPIVEPILTPTTTPPPADSKTSSSSSSSAAAAAAARPSPSKTTLPALLKSLPSSADAFLSHLQRCLATPSGVDTLLLFICYLSRFTGAALTRLSQALLVRHTARELVALVFTLPPKTAVILEATGGKSAHPRSAAAAQLAALLGKRLANLGSLASEARTIARLWGLVGMYFWAKRLTLRLFARGPGDGDSTSTSTSKLAALVDWVQLITCGAFQVLENGAYLSGRGVLGWTPAQQGRAYVLGSKWLSVYTALELGRLLAELVAKSGREQEQSEVSAKEKGEMDALRRSMAINLAWAPLTLHWSTEKGFLSDLVVGAGGCIPGVLQMRKLWRDTA
ncbi:hypothetical protein VM1G_00634 [Cytospora mali]|uniref:Peroxisomal membrane protein 11C n=1 Tax=Cytospora mali TaxID=578113 RepID=A0A194VKU7_CYTMA|nr:hypothetical protein VM1G_00634 [Valsa mali]